MDTQRLQTWLSLPPGEWPPEPHILLGLPPGSTDGLHERALEQMERLRPHQLLHPELVTEGMNRLAQALILLESAQQSVEKPNEILREPEPIAPPVVPAILEAEIVAQTFPTVQPEAAIVPKVSRKKRRKRVAEAPVTSASPVVAETAKLEAGRRRNYRKLAAIRQALRAWDGLGSFFGVPSQQLLTSADVYRYLVAIAEIRKSLQRFDSWPIANGTVCHTVLTHAATLALFRDLLKDQREALAVDWAQAQVDWRSQVASMNQTLRATKPKPRWRRRLRAMRTWCASHPEWILPGSFLGITAAVAWIRFLH